MTLGPLDPTIDAIGTNGNEALKAYDVGAEQSIQDRAHISSDFPQSPIILGWAMAHDTTPIWWSPARDKYLRGFWPTEPILAGALYTTQSKIRTTGWRLDGPQMQVNRYQELLSYAEFGKGWSELCAKLYIDYQSQDNGAWCEILGPGDKNKALAGPPTGLVSLDSQRVYRTGNLEYPIVYQSFVTGQLHRIHATRCFNITSMPSSAEDMYGMGYCGVSRVLLAARILRYIYEYKEEKLGGRPPRAILRGQGFQPKQVETALKVATEQANNLGLLRYMPLAFLTSFDPGVETALELVSLVGLPDNFDETQSHDMYWDVLAVALGVDRSELAPIRSGQLGSATQVDVQAEKARGKGPAEFFKSFENELNWKVLPDSTTFEFDIPDDGQDERRNQIKSSKVMWIRALGAPDSKGIAPISPQEQRQLAADEELIPGEWLDNDIFAEMAPVVEEEPDVTVTEQQAEDPMEEGEPDIVGTDIDSVKGRRVNFKQVIPAALEMLSSIRELVDHEIETPAELIMLKENVQSPPILTYVHPEPEAEPAPAPILNVVPPTLPPAPPPIAYDEEIQILEWKEVDGVKRVSKARKVRIPHQEA